MGDTNVAHTDDEGLFGLGSVLVVPWWPSGGVDGARAGAAARPWRPGGPCRRADRGCPWTLDRLVCLAGCSALARSPAHHGHPPSHAYLDSLAEWKMKNTFLSVS